MSDEQAMEATGSPQGKLRGPLTCPMCHSHGAEEAWEIVLALPFAGMMGFGGSGHNEAICKRCGFVASFKVGA